MKKSLILILILSSLFSYGQENVKIEIDNPEPRVGQKVTLSLKLNFLIDYLKDELGSSIELTRATSIHGLQSDGMDRVIIFNEAKKHKIGPFEFEFNGKKYTTNSIEVNVIPKLPFENGLWLRLTELNGQKYLIMEQLIENVSDKTYNEDGVGYTHTIGGTRPNGAEFAELRSKLAEGLELSNYSSASYGLRPDDAELFEVGYSYSIKKYKVKFNEDFKGKYTLTTADVINLPKKYNIEKIVLKK